MTAGPDHRKREEDYVESINLALVNRCTDRQQLRDTVFRLSPTFSLRPSFYDAVKAHERYLGTEDAIRLDERIRVLREVRNELAKAWRAADPYADGTGLFAAEKFLSWKLGEARRRAGAEVERTT